MFYQKNFNFLQLGGMQPDLLAQIGVAPHDIQYKGGIIQQLNTQALICFGFDPMLFRIVRANPQIRAVAIFEWQVPVFADAIHNYDLSAGLAGIPHVLFQIVENASSWDRIAERIEDVVANTIFKDYVESAAIINFKNEDTQEQKQLFANLTFAFRNALMKFGGGFVDSFIGFENMAKNMEYICKCAGIAHYRDCLKGKPVLIIGASPDIDEVRIEEIRTYQNRYIIFAADAILRKLKEAGIRVDFCFSLERVHGVANFWKDLDVGDTTLVAIPVLYPEVLDAYKGRIIVAARPFSHFEWLKLEKMPCIDTGPSCINMALNLGYYMGARNFVMIGVSLSYTDLNQSHAPGVHDICNIAPENVFQYATLPNGQALYSNAPMMWFKQEKERFIASHPDMLVYNCTRVGVAIEGADNSQEFANISKAFLEMPFVGFNHIEIPIDEIQACWKGWQAKKGEAIDYCRSLIKKCDLFKSMVDLIRRDAEKDGVAYLNMGCALVDQSKAYLYTQGNSNNFYYIIGHLTQTECLSYENKVSIENYNQNPIGVIKQFENSFDIIKHAATEVLKLFVNLE